MKIKISSKEYSFIANLNNTNTAVIIYDLLPLEGSANVWGEEIYFAIPANIKEETDAREIVEIGELGFWPVGSAFCIFFGPTPVSIDERPKAFAKHESPVSIPRYVSVPDR